MRTLLIVVAMAATAHAQARSRSTAPEEAPPWPQYNRGVKWERSLEAACQKAARENKPVMLFQLVGDLDREFC